MENVNVFGQTHKSWPSPYTDIRLTTDKISEGIHIYPRYMVGSSKSFNIRLNTLLGMPSYAQPMAIYKNGVFVKYEHQPGEKL